MHRLIVRPPTKPNESLLGYLSRLAEENVFQSALPLVWLTNLDTKDDKATIIKYIKRISSGEINLKDLAYISGERETDLEIKCYRLLERGIEGFPDFHLFMDAQIASYSLRFEFPRFCPDCMREDPYHRFFWDYVPLTCCPIHKKLLMDICPNCHKQISWARSSILHCECGYNFLKYDGVDVPDDQMEHVYLIANAINVCDETKHFLISFALMASLEKIESFATKASPAPKIRLLLPIPKRPLLMPWERRSLLAPVPVIKALEYSHLNIQKPSLPHLDNIHTLQDINGYLVDKLFHQQSRTRVKTREELQWQPNAEIHQKMVQLFTGKNVPLLENYASSDNISPSQKARHWGIKNSAFRKGEHSNFDSKKHLSSSFEQRDEILNMITAAQILGISEHLLNKLILGFKDEVQF